MKDLKAFASAYRSCRDSPDCDQEALDGIAKLYNEQAVEIAELVKRYALLCGFPSGPGKRIS